MSEPESEYWYAVQALQGRLTHTKHCNADAPLCGVRAANWYAGDEKRECRRCRSIVSRWGGLAAMEVAAEQSSPRVPYLLPF